MELLTDDCKEKGNACMKEEKYVEAMLHYTHGIKIEPLSPHLYSNRSLAFLRMQQYYHALEDAKTVIRMMPKWAKGYFRKGEIECAAEHYSEAVASYKQGLALVPEDSTLQNALAKAQTLLMNQRRVENRIPWYGIALGAVVGILLIVIDEAVAPKNPILGTDFVRTAMLVTVTAVCYGFAVIYRYFLRSQRRSLLESPPDLFGDDFLATPQSQQHTHENKSSSATMSTSESSASTSKGATNKRRKGRH